MFGVIREDHALNHGIALQWMTMTRWSRARKLWMHLYGMYKKDILAHKKASFRTMFTICYHVERKDESFTLYIYKISYLERYTKQKLLVASWKIN